MKKLLVISTVILMLMVIYIIGGIAIETVFDSHPVTAWFGFAMGLINYFCIDLINGHFNREQESE